MTLQDLKSFKMLEKKDAKLAGQVETIFKLTLETINGIARFYDNYTMHDMNHGLRVAAYMEELAFGIDENFDEKADEFNALELSLMILSAMLHDIGMFIRPEDEENIKNNSIKYTNSLTFEGVLKVSKNEEEAVKEIIRMTHAARINEFMEYSFSGKTINSILQVNDNYPYADDIVDICKAHGENYSYLKQLRTSKTKGSYVYNPQYIAVLLRIADYLDLDKQRTPILWYSMMDINGFSRDEWEKHFVIQNEKKLRAYMDDKMQIYFDGKSADAKIHRKYLRYIDELRLELENADNLLNTKNQEKKYLFNVSTKLDDCVQTEGFKYSDLRLNLDYSSITNLLMGKNIYGDYKLGLRELIQNSIDACKLLEEIKSSDPDVPVTPSIYIIYSKNNGYVKIKDTGIGMTLDIVKKHFLNVGKSYYKSNEYLYENHNYSPIGQFGIGFLACFLLSDNVTVKTKYYKNNEINQIELEKNSEYVVTNTEETTNFFGTEIILDYETFFNVFENPEQVISFVEKYFYTSIPIYLRNDDGDKSTIRIKNACDRIINNSIKDSIKSKYDSIICENYSSIISGVLRTKAIQRTKALKIQSFAASNAYVFNAESKTFQAIKTEDALETGYYYAIQYANISEDDYKLISQTKRSFEKKKKEILALATKNKNRCLLLISQNEFVDMLPTDFDYMLQINGENVDSILKNSGFAYYRELFNTYECIETIFAVDTQYIYLQDCVSEHSWREYEFKSEADSRQFFFYNKGIFVQNYRGIYYKTPYALETLAYINYTGPDLKLDVSRNTVIQGHQCIQKEVTSIVLKHLYEKEQNSRIKEFIEQMLKFN